MEDSTERGRDERGEKQIRGEKIEGDKDEESESSALFFSLLFNVRD